MIKKKRFANKNDSSDSDRKYIKYGVFWFNQIESECVNDSQRVDLNNDIVKAGIQFRWRRESAQNYRRINLNEYK